MFRRCHERMREEMRLFVAINFTDQIKETIGGVIKDLKEISSGGTFTQPENLHLTLAFIGETSRVDEVKGAMDQAVEKINAKFFTIHLEGLGSFKRSQGLIYWMGVKKNERLSRLNQDLIKALKVKGFPMEDRKFKPHLTLGRRIIISKKSELEDFKESIPSLQINVDRISLMKSQRIDGKLVYTEMYSRVFN